MFYSENANKKKEIKRQDSRVIRNFEFPKGKSLKSVVNIFFFCKSVLKNIHPIRNIHPGINPGCNQICIARFISLYLALIENVIRNN